ncbi:PKD-like domain-containing protein [Flavobacterium restrictum]|uniref:T9SS type B sorting domain-containing protein n=1 Tax=Flavobacterium restrictum TaxID=2594428 RepID=A0A553EDN0_9FLAO|nr:PKD-like domain-containing protein [Flavobacterium restrictum]TRX42923.1 T9SS type B sorting domain-containing protein [Flavobacterium restrictum]
MLQNSCYSLFAPKKRFFIVFVFCFLFTFNAKGQNLITANNPGFEGAGGFDSNGYTNISPGTSGISADGNYALTGNSGPMNTSSFINVTPHSGSKMMVVDANNQIFWKQNPNIQLQGGTTYTFSYWVVNINKNGTSNSSFPNPIIKIEALDNCGCTPVLKSGSATVNSTTWQQVVYEITPSGTGGKYVRIELSTPTASPNGNDFALDDLSLIAPPLPLAISASHIGISCPGLTDASISAYGFGGVQPYSYKLTPSTGVSTSNATGIFTNLVADTYTIEVTDTNSPIGKKTTSVVIDPIVDMTIAAGTTANPALVPATSLQPVNTSICNGTTITLKAANMSGYTWTATPVDPTLTTPNATSITVTPTQNTVYTVTANAPSGLLTNLVYNGDFEKDTAGFSSSYAYYATNPTFVQQAYGVISNPKTWGSVYDTATDYSGTGNMFITDGSKTLGDKVWGQNIAVKPGIVYDFDYFLRTITSTDAAHPAKLQLKINGVIVNNSVASAIDVAPTVTAGGWLNFKHTWTAGAGITTATVELYDTEISASGNDFGIDDITFIPQVTSSCRPSKSITVAISPGTSNTAFTYPTPVCQTTTVVTPVKTTPATFTAGGTWSKFAGAGTLSINSTTGVINPSLSTAGTYTVKYAVGADASICQAAGSSTFDITINVQPNAGTDGGATACESNTTTIDLYSLISGEQTGGTWARTSGTGGTFTAGAGTFAPAIRATTSTFSYTLTATAACLAAVSKATVTIIPQPSAGTDGGITVCESSTTAIDLYSLISGEQAGGTWARTSGTGGTFNAGSATYTPAVGATTSTFTYSVLGTAPCVNDTSIGTITINTQPNAGTSGGISVCESSTTAIDLFTLISGEQAGGSWSRTTGTGGTFNALVGSYSPAIGATTSTFSYTILGTAPCVNSVSVATVTLNTTPILTISCGTATATSVTFNWNAIAGATGYTYSYTPALAATVTGTISSPTTTLTVTGLTAGQSVSLTFTPVGSACPEPVSANCVASNCVVPIVNPIVKITNCANTTVSLIDFTSPDATATFKWTNTNITIGIPASGSGDITAFTALNTSAVAQTATITVTATDALGFCTGPATTFDIVVSPLPSLTLTSAPASTAQTPCINSGINTISYTIGGSATGAILTGSLPTGVTGNFAFGVYTIAGTPSQSGTFNYSVATTGGCLPTVTLVGSIVVSPSSILTLTSATATTSQTPCINTAINPITYAIIGSATSAVLTGSLPTGVTGTFSAGIFTITGTPSQSGTFNYSVATTGGCSPAAILIGTIVVSPQVPLPSVTPPSDYCQGSIATALIASALPGATLNWYGTNATGGIASTTAPIPSTAVAGTINYYVSQTISGCEGARAVIPVKVVADNGKRLSLFIDYAQSTATTLYFDFANVGQSSFTYTYTIDGGAPVTGNWLSPSHFVVNVASRNQCVTFTLVANGTPCVPSETVSNVATPNFAAIPAFCSGSTAPILAITSPNGIVGTWFPATINNTIAGSYEFTPNTSFPCANKQTLTTTITPNVTPTFTQVSAICAGTILAALPTTSNNGITGTWSPGLDNTKTTLYTFKPTAGLCATNATMTITVNSKVTPTFTAVTPICSGTILAALPTTSTNGIAGTWSPTLDNTKTTLYTFLPATGLCATTTTMTIVVNDLPTASISGSAGVCLGTGTTILFTGTPNATVSYTINGGTALTLVLDATGKASLPTGNLLVTTIYSLVSATNPTTLCSQTVSGTATVTIKPSPVATATPASQKICSGDQTGIVLSSTIAATTYNWTVLSQTGATGASAGTGASISQALTATGSVLGTVIYSIIPTANGCSGSPITVTIDVTPVPIAKATPSLQAICSGDTTSFVLSSNLAGATYEWNVVQTNVAGALAGSGLAIVQTLTTITNNTGQVVYTIKPVLNGCYGQPITVTIDVIPVPIANANPTAATLCSGETTAIALTSPNVVGAAFNWTVIQNGVSGATAGTGTAITQKLIATGSVAGTVEYTITPTKNACVGLPIKVIVTVNPSPEVFGPTLTTICSGESPSISLAPNPLMVATTFDWTVVQTGVTGATNGSGNTINQVLEATGTAQGFVIYTVTPSLNGCQGKPLAIKVLVNSLPNPTLADGIICVNQTSNIAFETYTLATGLSATTHTFEWFLSPSTTPIAGAIGSSYEALVAGDYSVIATNKSTGCISLPATATITASFPATTIATTQTPAFADDATITVTVSGGNGVYEYQLDDGPFQVSNLFTNVSLGPHQVTVGDTNGCTNLTQNVFIIGYPKFFTPNGDGYNENWNIVGLNGQPNSKIFLFDRYGKLLKQISPTEQGWDGTYNGQPLPADDYWFTVEYEELATTKVFRAHFTLKR